MLDWQTAIALGIVTLAASFVLRTMIHWLRGDSVAGSGCHGCPTGGGCNSAGQAVVQIKGLKPKPK